MRHERSTDRFIKLKTGRYTVLDCSDYERLCHHKWRETYKGYAVRDQYRNGKMHIITMSREIMNAPDELLVDHIDGNRLNNRRTNLRLVTPKENAQNRYRSNRNSKTGVRGVHYREGRRLPYVASIGIDWHTVHLGSFLTLEEAADVAESARRRLMPASVEARMQNRSGE